MEPAQTPIAWYYELAKYINFDGTYANFSICLSFEKPNVPEGSIRKLTPLYSKEQLCPPSPTINPTPSSNSERIDNEDQK